MKYFLVVLILCLSMQLYSQNDALRSLYKTTESLLSELDEQNDDPLFNELFETTSDLYAKLVEITVLYHMSSSVAYSKILHERLLLDIGKDVMTIVKLSTLYVPKLLTSSKVSWKNKVKKSSYILITITLLSLWIKECCSQGGLFSFTQHGNDGLLQEPFYGTYRPGIPQY